MHPLMGNPNPGDMTPIVTYAGCTEDRLQFCWTDEGDLKHLTSGLCIQVNIYHLSVDQSPKVCCNER